MQKFTLQDDVIDVRDIIEKYEELEDSDDLADRDYREALMAVLEDLAGNDGDEQWRGDWYPITLVRDSYFADYARQFAEEIGAISGNESWPHNCIDWKQAARKLQIDYSSVEIDGATYWLR